MTDGSKADEEPGNADGVSRRDFLGMVLTGPVAGAAGLGGAGSAHGGALPDASWPLSAASFDGYGGEGDYRFDNGNTWDTVNAAHRVRDGVYENTPGAVVSDVDAIYDLVVVGGGPAGLFSEYFNRQQAHSGATTLILDNHGVFGGLAKRNEMVVDGERIIAPQASNVFVSSEAGGERLIDSETLRDLGLDDAVNYTPLSGTESALDFDRTNFVYYYPPMNSDSIGFFFDSDSGYELSRNPFGTRFAGAPIGEELKAEFMRWRYDTEVPAAHAGDPAWLDSMTFHDYLRNVHGFSERFTRIVDTFIGGGKAFNGSMCSAYALTFNRYPGLYRRPDFTLAGYFDEVERTRGIRIDGFPGGNAFVARRLLKRLRPDAILGGDSAEDVITGTIRFDRLDQPGQATRIRLGATAISVAHAGAGGGKGTVEIVYAKRNRLYRVRARKVVMASGAWINKHILKDMPGDLAAAVGALKHAPTLVANVALRNWRFMERAGVTACLWDAGEFGFQCNIRRPAASGGYQPVLDPGKPVFLTFYAPFVYPGLPTESQLVRGRTELLSTPFAVFERRIRSQLTNMFGRFGFDHRRDIAGIILNRWGHAYVVPEPGFYFAPDGGETARDRIRRGYGSIQFAHSELRGFQSIESAYLESKRAIAAFG